MTARQMMTIPEICADLQVTEAEWNQWRADGLTPLHVVGTDGEPRVHAGHYHDWFKSLRVEDVDPADIDAYERGAFDGPAAPGPEAAESRAPRPWDVLTAPLSPDERAKADAQAEAWRRGWRPWNVIGDRDCKQIPDAATPEADEPEIEA